MKLAHLADVHLGFRQYHRLTSQGVNQREADVAGAFRKAMQGIIAAEPDVVVIAGDLFHSVRPSNPAILDSFNQLRQFRAALPHAPIVIVAGDHDTPRSVETGSILKLFEAVGGIRTVTQQARELVFEDLDLALLAVPYAALLSSQRPRLVPGTSAGRQVLLVHGALPGLLPWITTEQYGGALLEAADLHASAWDYVALGHYHVAHQVAPNAWYAGALEYVTRNPWGELRDEAARGRPEAKGWLLVQWNDAVSVDFRPVALARRHIDLEPLHAAGWDARQIDAAVRERVANVPGGIEGHVVRQVVYDVPRPVARDLDYAQVREFKARALHFHFDLRRPERAREVGVGAPGARQTLRDVLVDYLKRRPLDADLDRARLIALGREYMEQVEREGPGA